MFYFQYFPKINYRITEKSNNELIPIIRQVPNMTVKLELDIFKDGAISFDTYRIKDSDRPDTVAAQMYGSSRYAWVILLANKMKDWYDWPLTDFEFHNYMNKKYESYSGANDGVEASSAVIHQYIWITDDDRELIVDQTTYDSLPDANKRSVTVYDYEYTKNDEKRLIRLVSSI